MITVVLLVTAMSDPLINTWRMCCPVYKTY